MKDMAVRIYGRAVVLSSLQLPSVERDKSILQSGAKATTIGELSEYL